MKKSDKLQNLVTKLVEQSFRDEKQVESQIIKSIKLLKSLPLPLSKLVLALSEYLHRVKLRQNKRTMFIETVIPLTEIQLKQIKKIMEKKAKITKVVTSINPEILGGFKLRIGDQIWDLSIRSKIRQIKEAIAPGVN